MVVLFAVAHSSVNSISVLSALYASSTVVSIFFQKYIEMTVERMHSCYSFSSLSHSPSPSSFNFIWADFSTKKKRKSRLSLPPHISLLRFLSRCWAGQSGPSYCQPRQDKIQPNSLGLGFMKTYEDMGSECKNSAQRKRCFNPYVNRETDCTDFFFAAGCWTYMWNHYLPFTQSLIFL